MKRGLVAVAALGVLAAACGYADPYASNGPVANESPGPSASAAGSPGSVDNCNDGSGLPAVTYPDGLKLIDLKVGTGAVAVKSDDATVQYTGWLTSCGKPFDTSRQPGRTPYQFQIGQGNVIPGWDEGVVGMKVGGKRKLVIPPELAYGAQGQTDQSTGATIIPANATLVFDVELTAVAPGPSPSPSPSPSASPSPSHSP